MKFDVILLAGGFGTRLQQVVHDVPKPMATVNGKPFLEHIFNHLLTYPIQTIVLSVGYKAEIIQKYFGDNYKNCPIKYAIETQPLGTGGGIKLAMQQCVTNDVLVMNADSFFKIDLTKMYEVHKTTNAHASIALRQLPDTSRFGTVTINHENKISSFKEKNGKHEPGFINGGVYFFRKNIFDSTNLPEQFSIEKDFFELYCTSLNFTAFVTDGYFIDIGIPEDYKRAQDEFAKF